MLSNSHDVLFYSVVPPRVMWTSIFFSFSKTKHFHKIRPLRGLLAFFSSFFPCPGSENWVTSHEGEQMKIRYNFQDVPSFCTFTTPLEALQCIPQHNEFSFLPSNTILRSFSSWTFLLFLTTCFKRECFDKSNEGTKSNRRRKRRHGRQEAALSASESKHASSYNMCSEG